MLATKRRSAVTALDHYEVQLVVTVGVILLAAGCTSDHDSTSPSMFDVGDVETLVETLPGTPTDVRWTRSTELFESGPIKLDVLFEDEVEAAFLPRVRQAGLVGGRQVLFTGQIDRGPPTFGAGALGVRGFVFRDVDGARIAFDALHDAERAEAHNDRAILTELVAEGLGEEGYGYRADYEEGGLIPFAYGTTYAWRRGNLVLSVFLIGQDDFLAKVDL